MPSPPFVARHLPPSAGRPRTLALDPPAAARLAREGADVALIDPSRVAFGLPSLPFAPAAFDAVVLTRLGPEVNVTGLLRLLRPGGRLIALVPAPQRAGLLDRLAADGCIHLFAENEAGEALVRGERPPEAAAPVDRIAALAASVAPPEAGLRLVLPGEALPARLGRSVHLLIAQTPNKPVWRLEPGDRVEWRAAVVAGPGGVFVAPAFTSLVKAVAFMQAAVLAGVVRGVNKVGKFPAAAAQNWPFALVLDPSFADWQAGGWAKEGWRWEPVDPGAAIRDE